MHLHNYRDLGLLVCCFGASHLQQSHVLLHTSFALPCSIVLRVWLDGRPCGVRLAAQNWTPLHHLPCPSKSLGPPLCISLNIWVGTYWQGAPAGHDAAAAVMTPPRSAAAAAVTHAYGYRDRLSFGDGSPYRSSDNLAVHSCVHQAAGGAVTMHVSNLLPALYETRKAPICSCC